ncbi:MAG: hypothetical protein H6Q19_924 [Bacteroidetes bacterium]|nr:hypothetical protein [Bacteroidota bacterium]
MFLFYICHYSLQKKRNFAQQNTKCMKLSLQKIIAPSFAVTALTYTVSFGLWIAMFFLYRYPNPMPGIAGAVAENFLSSGSILAYLITFAVTVLNSLLIAQMNNKFAFIRTRTFMPVFIYLLLSTCWLQIHGNYLAVIASFFLLVAVFLSLQMYKDTRGVEQAFLAFFCVSLGSLLVHDLVYLLPFFWIGFIFLRCFSFRTFFASVFGFITPLIFVYSIMFFIMNQTTLFPDSKGVVFEFQFLNYANLPLLIYFGAIFLIFSLAMTALSGNTRHDVIQARNMLFFLRVMAFGLLMLLIFRFSNYTYYLPLIAALFAILTAYTFTLVKNLFYYIVFIVLCVVSLAYVVFQLYF